MSKYRKSRAFSPEGFFECEGRGLQWLGEAQSKGGPRVVDVYDWGKDYLNIERVTPVVRLCRPRMISALLSRVCMMPEPITLDLPSRIYGNLLFRPLAGSRSMDAGEWDDVATYLAEGRLRPMVQLGMKRRELTDYDMELTEAVIEALPEILGKAANDKPARVHGDLWSGNVMWSADSGSVEAVLIDPAAHGGHREEDLAMLDLFGMSYLRDILDGYQSVHPLKAGWQERTTLWQLYPHRRPLRVLRRWLCEPVSRYVPVIAQINT